MSRSKRWAAADNDEDVGSLPSIVMVKSAMSPVSMMGGDAGRQRNHLYFHEDVTEESASRFISDLRETTLDMQRSAMGLEVDPPPIHVHISSFGGVLFAGFAMYDAIRECPLKVHTHIEGQAASAATLLSVAGSKRTIGRNAFILIHQLSSWFMGTFEEQKDEMTNNELLMKTIKRIYKDRAKLPAKKLTEILKQDLWLDAETALKYGLVDEIRGPK